MTGASQRSVSVINSKLREKKNQNHRKAFPKPIFITWKLISG